MKALILHGNTRVKSNTETLANALANELRIKGAEVSTISLRVKNIQSCVGCDKCHSFLDSFGCAINDDMHEVAKGILESDLVIFSSPIYSWMPTPPLKAVMDRIYAFTKYPANADAFNLLKSQKIAMVATSASPCETNCDLFDEAVRRMANYAKLTYLGYLSAQDKGDGNIVTPAVADDVCAFAEKCVSEKEIPCH